MSKHFKLNEIVDAIDECYIWWQAEVIEFIGEWEVVVRWKEFGKEKSKIQINSTVRKTSEKWNVRKTKVTFQKLQISQFPQMKRGAMNHGIQCWESCGTERLALTVRVTNTSKRCGF